MSVLHVVGTNHKRAALADRERLIAGRDGDADLLERTRRQLGASECVLLRTCNRVEIYFVTPPDSCEPRAAELLSDDTDCGERAAEGTLYHYHGEQAAVHLFGVACGLDSMVLGEHEILGQVRSAVEEALETGHAGRVLTRVFTQAIRAGKRVRRDTAISSGIFSAGQCAARLAQQVLGSLEGKRLLVFGAGRMAKVTTKHMQALGVGPVVVFSRTSARAQDLAAMLGGRAVSAEEVPQALREADIVVGCAAAPHHVVGSAQIEEAMKDRNRRPLVVVDLGMPRNVDPAAGEVPGVCLFNLDHLEAVVAENVGAREAEIQKAQAIVEEEVAQLRCLEAGEVIARLRARAEELRQECLAQVEGKLGDEELALLDYLTDLLVRKLLHAPMIALRESSRRREARGLDLAEAATELFELGTPAGAMLAAATMGWSRVPVQAQEKAPITGPAVDCAACHTEAAEQWAASLHRRTVGAVQVPEERQSCAACHRGASEHLADVADASKRPRLDQLTGDQVADICQSCHRGGKQMMWELSAHASTEEGCLACHDPHGGKGEHMLNALEPELCQECHPDTVAEGKLPSHHPVAEGKMVCTDCHNVHGDERGNLPEASNGEMCFRCHAEKQGPFAAEHPPVTEDCTICHRPHGSSVDNLLTQDQPLLCLQCHPGHSDSHRSPLVPTTPNSPEGLEGIVGFYGRCTSCHSRIHGTDLLSGTWNPTFMPGSPLGSGPAPTTGSALGASALDQGQWGFSEIDFARLDQADNPAYVREYDGRDYEVPTSRLSIVKYGEDSDFRFEVVDLPRGDQDISLRTGGPRWDVQVVASGLTHRLGRYDDPTDVLISRDGGRTMQVNTTDLSGGRSDYELHRTVVDVRLAARCPKLPNAKWLVNYWQESEHGSRQFLFLDRCISCHKIQTTEPLARVTTITEAGVQVDLPKASLRYLYGKQEFSNQAEESYFAFNGSRPTSIFNGLAPLFGVANTRTTTNDLRGAALINDRASVAGLWRSKARDNELGKGTTDIRSVGAGVSYALSQDVRLRASHFRRSLDVAPAEEAVSRDRDTTRVDLSYTGIPNATWSVGYAREGVARESEREMVPWDTDSSIWTSSLTFRPTSRVSLQLRCRRTDSDFQGLHQPASPDAERKVASAARLLGLPSDGQLWSGVLAYRVDSDTALSGMYSRRRDRYQLSLPELGVSRSAEERVRTHGVQLTHSRNRAQLSAGFYRQEGDNRSDVTYGTEGFVLEPGDILFDPILANAGYHYDASIQTADGSLWATSRLRLFARWARTSSDGQQTACDLGDYLDQDPDLDGTALILHPFDIDIRDRWAGAGYQLDPDTEVVLSHQRRSWADAANVTHDGAYDIWRLALRKRF